MYIYLYGGIVCAISGCANNYTVLFRKHALVHIQGLQLYESSDLLATKRLATFFVATGMTPIDRPL